MAQSRLIKVALLVVALALVVQVFGEDTELRDERDMLENVSDSGEKFGFQAEVSRMLNIIINSLYTNKEIFLRELISNASDALDKVKYLLLTDKESLKDSADVEFEIRIQPDPDNKMIHVTDTGIGMTREELVTNLGTIAQSGTRGFIEKMKETADANLIGQFGVGFYSSFLVADAVSVATKSPFSDKQYIWQSRADDSFSITEDPRGVTLKRGTRISLLLKDDTEEFLQEDRLRDMIKRYSEFINFPIYLYTAKEVEKEIEIEEEEEQAPEEGEKKEEDNADQEKDDAEAQEEKPKKKKTKTVTETEYAWELVNQNKPDRKSVV